MQPLNFLERLVRFLLFLFSMFGKTCTGRGLIRQTLRRTIIFGATQKRMFFNEHVYSNAEVISNEVCMTIERVGSSLFCESLKKFRGEVLTPPRCRWYDEGNSSAPANEPPPPSTT